jgi:hypothetical protein
VLTGSGHPNRIDARGGELFVKEEKIGGWKTDGSPKRPPMLHFTQNGVGASQELLGNLEFAVSNRIADPCTADKLGVYIDFRNSDF